MYIGASDLLLPAHVNITGSSLPVNIGAVGSIISEVCDEIDGAAAAAGYAVSIVPPASGGPTIGFGQMVSLAKKGVTYRVLSLVFPNLPGKTSMVDDYRKEYLDALKAIQDGKTPIVGAGFSSSGEGRQLPRSYSTSNSCATSGVVPQIRIGQRF